MQLDVCQLAAIGDGGEVGTERLPTPVRRRSRVEQTHPVVGRRVPRYVTVPEHEYVGIGVCGRHPALASCRGTGLVYDGEAQAAEYHVGTFGHHRTQLVAIVVSPAGDQRTRSLRECLERREIHPIAGMNHHIGVVDGGPHLIG